MSRGKEKIPMEVEWNRSPPPRGKWINVKKRLGRKKERVIKIWDPDKIWAYFTGDFEGVRKRVLLQTYWIPTEDRWCMLVKGQEIEDLWATYRKPDGKELPPEKVSG